MQETNKRVRFSEEPSSLPSALSTKSSKLSPKTVALSSLRSFTATLQPNLKPIFTNLGEEWLDIVSRHRTKMLQVMKMMNDEDFIPRSARTVNFTFHVPKSVEDLAEFTEIKEETEAIVLKYRKDLKSQILKAMKLEIEQLETRAKILFIKATNMIIKATLISTSAPLTTIHPIAATIMEYNHAKILENVGITLDEFNEAYKSEHAIATYPPVFAPVEDQTTEAYDAERIKQSFPSKTNIIATLVTPLDRLLEREKEIEIDISLKKLNAEEEQGKSNEDTQQRMDTEVSVDKELISELISKATAEKTKSIRSELGQLKKMVRELKNPSSNSETKKEKRGRKPQGGASSKKKNTKATGKKPGNKTGTHPSRRDRSRSRSRSPSAPRRKKQPARKADDQDSDSSSKRRKKKTARQRTRK